MGEMKRALISVSDKTGIVELGQGLHNAGVEILSTGGTARLLAEHGVSVREVSDYTGFPEIMDGRVKTLHPKIHGGVLARRGVDDDAMREHHIAAIDLVVVNLYPFERTIAQAECTLQQAIENIDIGGPALLRAAAKNHASVVVVVDPRDYTRVLDAVGKTQSLTEPERFALAVKAFQHTAAYDTVIAQYLAGRSGAPGRFPDPLGLVYRKARDLRYGENPHQQAAFYREARPPGGSVGAAAQIQGKDLSFNNIADADAALECVAGFDETACVIVKHANPCGAAIGATVGEAYHRAYKTDPTSAFGGIVAFNRPLDLETANAIVERQFVEVIAAPEFAPDAVSAIARKADIRLLQVGRREPDQVVLDYRSVNGGLLVQDRDLGRVETGDLKVVSKRSPTSQELKDLLFAWRVAKFVKSNAIVYAKDGMTIGIGAGQMSRVYSARLAAIKAADEGLQVRGSVMASDAFFPFRDGIDSAGKVGVSAVIQPGGSKRDDEVVAAADTYDIAMVFTGMRHFRH